MTDKLAPIPAWPTIVVYADGSELGMVNSQDQWELDPDLHARSYDPEDRIIDSAGVEYRLVLTGSRNAIEPTGRRYTSEEVQPLASHHMKSMGAQPEWLATFLSDIADPHKIRATILYLSKLERAEAADEPEDGE